MDVNLNRRTVACNRSVALLPCHMLHFNTRESPAIAVDEAALRGQRCSAHYQKDHKTHLAEVQV
jgi:hypothetical protein